MQSQPKQVFNIDLLRTTPTLTSQLSVAHIFLSTDKKYPNTSIVKCNPRNIDKIIDETKNFQHLLEIKGSTIIVPNIQPAILKQMAKKAAKPFKERTERKASLQKLSQEFLSENTELVQALWLFEIVPCRDEPEHSMVRIQKTDPEYKVFQQFPNHFIFTKSGMIKIKGFTPFQILEMLKTLR